MEEKKKKTYFNMNKLHDSESIMFFLKKILTSNKSDLGRFN